jgi:hypothetical protein
MAGLEEEHILRWQCCRKNSFYDGRVGGRTHPKVAVLQEEQFL